MFSACFSTRTYELKAKLKALGASQAIIEFKADGTILTANERFLSTMGYALHEIKGRHHSMFVDPAYKESAEYRRFWEALGRGEYQAAEYKRIGKNGNRWLGGSGGPHRRSREADHRYREPDESFGT